MRPYSLRDLRSALHVHTLTYSFFGDYEYSTRRWRFTSADSAREARAFIDSTPPPCILHDPDAPRHVDGIRARGGFSLVARNDEGSNKRGTATYLFRDDTARFEATKYLFPRTRADATLVARAQDDLKSVGDGIFGEPSAVVAERIRDAQPSAREVHAILARCAAARALGTPSAGEMRDDRAATLDDARMFCPTFDVKRAPATGVVSGLVAARGAYHIAVQTEHDGRGVLLERRGIAMPLAQQTLRERTFSTWDAIRIELGHDGIGTADQLPGERDIEIGTLRLAARAHARRSGLASVVQDEDFSPREDLHAPIIDVVGDLACALDAGASICAKCANQSKCASTSAPEMLSTGTSRRRPMMPASSRNGTPSAATA